MIVTTAHDAARLFGPAFADSEAAHLAVLHLDAERRMLALDIYPNAGADETKIPKGKIMGAALRYGATAIMIAHNRPSGNPEPSDAEIAATQKLADTMRSVGIHLSDRLIFAGGEWRSLRALGLL